MFNNTTLIAQIVDAAGSDSRRWQERANCYGVDPDLFFPVGTTGQALISIDHAKRVCRECTVTSECLDFALETNQDSGIWGGLSAEERRQIRRQRAAAARATRAS